MAGLNFEFDDKDFQQGMNKFGDKAGQTVLKALDDIGMELLRLSQAEVPHDKGILQDSGEHHMDGEEAIVGYHTPYAHRMHEHPEYRFQAGRKGKFLEDPMKHNLDVFRNFFDRRMGDVYGGL